MTRALLLLAAVAATAVLAAGCSNGQNVYATNPKLAHPHPTLSVGRFVIQANRICRDAALGLSALTPPTDAQSAIAFLQATVAIADTEVRGLEALQPPAGQRAPYLRFVTAVRDTVVLLRGPLEQAIRARDFERLNTLRLRLPVLAREAKKRAAAAGLATCARRAG